MKINIREYKDTDYNFLKEMLFEAVFWRKKEHERPPFEEGLKYDGVRNALEDWQRRAGDTALVAEIDSVLVGAVWYRYFTEDNNIRGYYDNNVPVVVIGVHKDSRHKGIGGRMMQAIFDYAAKQNINKLSLCVSKDNYAINLYKQQGFVEHIDIGDSWIMVKVIMKNEKC